ncbi:MAG: hypothetical protein LBB55_05620, partial [Zoogloeaceae bacterium]|nr:hypothetical protein [Zoogloeaceae bacterium]
SIPLYFILASCKARLQTSLYPRHLTVAAGGRIDDFQRVGIRGQRAYRQARQKRGQQARGNVLADGVDELPVCSSVSGNGIAAWIATSLRASQ